MFTLQAEMYILHTILHIIDFKNTYLLFVYYFEIFCSSRINSKNVHLFKVYKVYDLRMHRIVCDNICFVLFKLHNGAGIYHEPIKAKLCSKEFCKSYTQKKVRASF